VAFSFMIARMDPGLGHRYPLRFRLAMVAILLVAAALRLHALPSIPPGMTHDEADHGLDAWGVVQGNRPVYFTVGYGREPLYDYSTAVLMSFLGPTYLAGRLTAVFFGLFLIAGMGAWTRRAFDAPTALLAAAGLAVAFWPVMTARQALRSVTMPALFLPGLLSFWRGMDAVRRQRGAWPFWAAAGIWLGLSFYTYIPARVTWLLLPAVATYLWLRGAPHARQMGRGAGLAVLAALALGLPLFAYLASHPSAELRIGQLAGPLDEAFEGNIEPLFSNIQGALGLFSGRGDSAWRYNIAGRPWLPLLPALLFYAGLLVAGWQAARARLRRAAAAWAALVWLLLGLSPALVTGPELSTTQAIALQPVLFLFPALGLSAGTRWLAPKLGQPAHRLLLLAALPLLAGWLLSTYRAYFQVWARHPEVAVQYEANLVEAVRYLDTLGEQTVAVSTDAPGRFHDAATAALFRTNDAVALRWFDGRYSLLLPAAEGMSSLFFTTGAPPAAALQPYLDVVAQTITVLPQGKQVYVDNEAGFQRLFPQFSPLTHSLSTELSTGADFGGVVRWLGAAAPAGGKPGETVTVATLWEVTTAARPDLVLFLHLLGEDGRPAAQVDRLDVPSEQWRVGDRFVQLHEVVLPQAGRYPVAVGVYPAADWRQRLPLMVEGAAAGDMLLLPALEVWP
jgi:4-amino-4-deoxy-L-arabinose transferase-like glycosyltransferase